MFERILDTPLLGKWTWFGQYLKKLRQLRYENCVALKILENASKRLYSWNFLKKEKNCGSATLLMEDPSIDISWKFWKPLDTVFIWIRWLTLCRDSRKPYLLFLNSFYEKYLSSSYHWNKHQEEMQPGPQQTSKRENFATIISAETGRKSWSTMRFFYPSKT